MWPGGMAAQDAQHRMELTLLAYFPKRSWDRCHLSDRIDMPDPPRSSSTTVGCSDDSIRIGPRPTGGKTMPKHRIFATKFAGVYPLYVQKAERKNRTKDEVDQIICWLTGYSQAGLKQQIEQENDFETFFAQAPAINPNSLLITGMVCGVRVEEIEDPLMQKIRYLDKLIDELAKGKAMEKILRQ
jgi:hypothetical protein